jgi:large subunit ribosomal protein L16
MPLMPKRVKYRKVQRGSRSGLAQTGNKLAYGEFGLQALERGWITGVQIEACRVAANRKMKRKGKAVHSYLSFEANYEEAIGSAYG